MTTIVTWNCNMAFRRKQAQLLRYEPDVVVVQECESPSVNGEWSAFSDWVWVGENEHKGLAVFTTGGRSVETPGVSERGGRFTLPVVVEGVGKFIAVWAMNDETTPQNRYIGQVYRALLDYRRFVDEGTTVLGDFNWNVMWDESPKSRLVGDFSETVGLLAGSGLRSAYHEIRDVEFGNEDDPTFFMHKKRERAYHTDYVFVPNDWTNSGVRVEVGAYDEWIDASDHMPIVVDVSGGAQ